METEKLAKEESTSDSPLAKGLRKETSSLFRTVIRMSSLKKERGERRGEGRGEGRGGEGRRGEERGGEERRGEI